MPQAREETFQSLSGLTLCCDFIAVFLGIIAPPMFQSLSGLTLCCDSWGEVYPRDQQNLFQSLSGLTLCCDLSFWAFSALRWRCFNPFQG